MFRELAKKQKAIDDHECIALLKRETRGVLSVLGDDDYPYGMPLNHYYDEESGNIYFHSGNGPSHRTDALKKHNKVSFCCFNKGERGEGQWAYRVKSVVVFGKISFIDDEERIKDISAKLSRKFTSSEEYIEKEIKANLHKTLLLELKPEHISGKVIVEA